MHEAKNLTDSKSKQPNSPTIIAFSWDADSDDDNIEEGDDISFGFAFTFAPCFLYFTISSIIEPRSPPKATSSAMHFNSGSSHPDIICTINGEFNCVSIVCSLKIFLVYDEDLFFALSLMDLITASSFDALCIAM
eukprot:c7078_g1_i1.p2 GENE.c7078_g1_i1~~c7078_g1_i1.p2  ORF type:complete len:135 (+),score=9.47 c7078_g1_i1:541-945(+)